MSRVNVDRIAPGGGGGSGGSGCDFTVELLLVEGNTTALAIPGSGGIAASALATTQDILGQSGPENIVLTATSPITDNVVYVWELLFDRNGCSGPITFAISQNEIDATPLWVNKGIAGNGWSFDTLYVLAAERSGVGVPLMIAPGTYPDGEYTLTVTAWCGECVRTTEITITMGLPIISGYGYGGSGLGEEILEDY